jgi:hypothetical protein
MMSDSKNVMGEGKPTAYRILFSEATEPSPNWNHLSMFASGFNSSTKKKMLVSSWLAPKSSVSVFAPFSPIRVQFNYSFCQESQNPPGMKRQSIRM